MEAMSRLANHPFSIPGLSDGGAHMKFLTAAIYPTYFLGTLCRDNNVMSLEKHIGSYQHIQLRLPALEIGVISLKGLELI